MNKSLKDYILAVESTIDSVIDTMQINVCTDATISEIEYVLLQIKKILPYEKEGVTLKGKKPSEYIEFFQQKISEYKDEQGFFDNLRMALGYDNWDSYSELEIEEIQESIEKCKSSNNIHDKLALAIYYENMGREYYPLASELYQEYAQINPSNPLLTPIQVLFRAANFHEKNKDYAEALWAYQCIFQISPDNPMVYDRTINLFLKMQRRDLAEKAIISAKQTDYYKKLPYFKYVIDNIKI